MQQVQELGIDLGDFAGAEVLEEAIDLAQGRVDVLAVLVVDDVKAQARVRVVEG